MTEIPRADPELVKALAREAKSLLEDRAFTTAVKTLRQQWFGEMMRDGLSDVKVLELRAMLKALEAIPARLESMTHDPEFAHARRNR